ncbi:NAD(P)/FAD-dependent oxidoreductase [Actinospica sp.]|uniref:NAD(P)/FAD-dependent oxidoreductase n=1 Tax=Actinospica sp. TaxID=1872142 RepID=UPI002CE4C6C9|nr:NAD(P)/FAD-dependent oxidoreductase [Actinospica sp.]HWG24682.1 NAD(P)/FAD-dependent oxidoreductase [Actinospica sp.]
METAHPETDGAGTVIIGAGPAGLTAAYDLTRHGYSARVFESESVVGGISQTAERGGWRFDIGGHRFFIKVKQVDDLWHEILPAEDFLLRPRMSRIHYQGKLFDYPLKAGNALSGLGDVEAAKCIGSYAWPRIRPPKNQDSFDGWATARFGRRLFRIFFKTYTEKVWGMDTGEPPADWAAQRIKNLSLFGAIVNALDPRKGSKRITSLIDEFHYPKYGPGMMWETCADGTEHERIVPASDVISSTPLSALVLSMDPPASPEAIEAAKDLRYRDSLTVALVVPEEHGFPDNWIYIHTPGVRVGRIQNFGSWSPYLVKEGRTCLGLEFFVNEGDELWTMDDDDLVKLGTAELEELALITPGSVEVGYVVRMPKAYPVYDDGYAANLEVLKAWLREHTPNVHPVGRNGVHRYNNADHSMLTALLSSENIRTGSKHDVWSVNVEEEYHEESADKAEGRPVTPKGTGRDAPVTPRRRAEDKVTALR